LGIQSRIRCSGSGVKLKIWFKAGLNMDEEDSEKPDEIVPLIPKINFKKEIEF